MLFQPIKKINCLKSSKGRNATVLTCKNTESTCFARKFINLTQLKSHCDLLGPFFPIHNLFSALEADPFKEILRNAPSIYEMCRLRQLLACSTPHHNFPSLSFQHRMPSLTGVSLTPCPFTLSETVLMHKSGLLNIVASADLFTY